MRKTSVLYFLPLTLFPLIEGAESPLFLADRECGEHTRVCITARHWDALDDGHEHKDNRWPPISRHQSIESTASATTILSDFVGTWRRT